MMVQITQERLRGLELSELKLECLEGSGVDNWEGYDYAMTEYYDCLEKLDKEI